MSRYLTFFKSWNERLNSAWFYTICGLSIFAFVKVAGVDGKCSVKEAKMIENVAEITENYISDHKSHKGNWIHRFVEWSEAQVKVVG